MFYDPRDIEMGWRGMFEMPEPVPRPAHEATRVEEPNRNSIGVPASVGTDLAKLRQAISNCDLVKVKRLRAKGVSLGCYTEKDGLMTTPLHYCVKEYARYWRTGDNQTDSFFCQRRRDEVAIMNELLPGAIANSAINLKNLMGDTPLLTAIKAGDIIVETLINAGARKDDIGINGQTALQEATLHHHILKYLLDNHYTELSSDEYIGAIYYAAKFGELPSMKILLKRSLRSRIDEYVNSADEHGFTPVYYSAKRGHLDMTALLLNSGATLSLPKKKTVVEIISTQFANSSTFFDKVFDNCIEMKSDNVFVEYHMIGSRQIQVMEDLIKYEQSKLLKHPLMQSLIYLKWKCLQPMYMTIMGLYGMFLILFHLFVVSTFMKKDSLQDKNSSNETSVSSVLCTPIYVYGWYLVIYVFILVFLAQECMWLYLQRLSCLKRLEPWVSLLGLALAAGLPPALGCAPAPAQVTWQRHLACTTLLLLWFRALLLLSRVPVWGHYVLMFQAVAINISKIFGMLIGLVLAFGICFMVEYHSKLPFDNPWDSILKTLVMMSSEFDYEDLFDKSHEANDVLTSVFIHVLFVVFVIFIATVMMNFMIGVAVSDINELAAIGTLKALEMHVQLLSNLKGVEETILGKWFSKISRIKYHSYITHHLSTPTYTWIHAYTRYFEQYSETLPEKLHNDVLKIAKKEKHFQSILSDENSDSYDTSEMLEKKIESLEDHNKEIIKSVSELSNNVNKMMTVVKTGIGMGPVHKKLVSSAVGFRRRNSY